MWEGAGDRTELKYFDTHSYGRQRCLSRSPDAQPEALGSTLLGAGFLYCILSATSLVPKLHRGSLGRMWLSLPQLSPTGTWTPLSWLSYIIVQHPLDRPLDLWNRMFNRHQAEITVMQFRGHSLPVRQSMRVSWDFFSLSHFVSQFPPTRFPLLTAIGMCHFLPVHHLEWHFGPGWRSKYNTGKPLWNRTGLATIMTFNAKKGWLSCTS